MYAPADRFIWDYWLIHVDGRHHLFHLQAPRTLKNPDLRHAHATIGHAVSNDLIHWTPRPDALGPDPFNDYDRDATHTGSVIAHDSRYWMLYSGRANGRRSICLAISDDLDHWQRHPDNPVLEIDEHWYDPDGAWADPFVIREPQGKGFYAFFKAYDRRQPEGYRGCIGAARSDDLVRWEALPPVYSPGLLREPEVPAVYCIEGRYFLIMMLIPPVVTDAYCRAIQPRQPQWGDIYLVADHPLGPYTPPAGIELTRTDDQMMMVRLVKRSSGQWCALSWWQGYADNWHEKRILPTPTNMPCVFQDPRLVQIDPGTDRIRILRCPDSTPESCVQGDT